MKHRYSVFFNSTRAHPKRAIRALGAKFFGVELDLPGESIHSENEKSSRALFAEAKRRGFKCSLEVHTRYDRGDALIGELGILYAAPGEGKIPKDAFDFSTGCPSCGVGAAQVRPHVLAERYIRYRGNFLHGHNGTMRVLMRPEIAREIIAATGQPWCMRHPLTRAGKVVEQWMEPVPCATMPPLSPKSEGVRFGSTTSTASAGEPAEIIPPCPACGRVSWDYDYEQHTRLIYPRAAIEAAQKHAVVAMHEPYAGFPAFDPARRTFRHLYGLPWLLFNREAVKVLAKYLQPKYPRTMSYIEPVFSE